MPYVLTVADDGRPHAVGTSVDFDGADLVLLGGRRTLLHATARPSVTLLWPPGEPGGYSLVVDGTAAVDGERITIRPTSAVLHRPLAGSPHGNSECVTVLGP